MSDDGDWLELLSAFTGRHIDEAVFHDRFFERWRAERDGPDPLPPAIEDLFYVVEAYCPDPALRTPDSLLEADDAELRASAEIALARLVIDRPSGKLT